MPTDKSIAHRAFLLAALAQGQSRIGVRDLGGDVQSTLGALEAMGVVVDRRASEVSISGVGLEGLRSPAAALDAGNSGTTMRLLAGILSGQRFSASIDGDTSLRRRPMGRIVEPLRRMRARIEGRQEGAEVRAPLVVSGLRPGERLRGIEHVSPVPSAQVKSAILLAGSGRKGPRP